MKCPRCGLQQEHSEECRGCGIIIARYLERQAAAPRPAAPARKSRTWYPPLARDRELRNYYSAQSQLLTAGLTAMQAHENFIASRPAIKDMAPYRRIEQSLRAGRAISDGMAKSPDYFPEHHARVIDAGEQAGNPAHGFNELYDNVDVRIRTVEAIKKELRKPTITLVSSFFIMPLPSLFTHGVAGYLDASLLPFALMVLGLVALWQGGRLLLRNQAISLPVARLLLYVPVYRTYTIARFSRVFRTLYAAGIDMPGAFATATAASGNRLLEDRLAACPARLAEGETLTAVMRQAGVFPGDLQQFVATGESAGSLDVSLARYLLIANERFERQLGRASSLLALSIGLLMSLYVGYQIVQGFKAEMPKVPLPQIQQ